MTTHHRTVQKIVAKIVRPLSFAARQAVDAVANTALAYQSDWDELPDTAFQRALDDHGACVEGCTAVGARSFAEFWTSEQAARDLCGYCAWLAEQADEASEGVDPFVYWSAQEEAHT